MFTVNDIALRLKISEALVYALIQEGALACHRFGKAGKRGTVRVSEEQLTVFL